MLRKIKASWRKWFDKDVKLLYNNGYLSRIRVIPESYSKDERNLAWVAASTWFNRGCDLLRMRAQGTFDELVKLNQGLQDEWEHYEPFLKPTEGEKKK